MSKKSQPSTSLCTYTSDAIFVRGKNLTEDLIGKISFTEMMFLDIFGRLPSVRESTIIDAILVTVMEHGLAPSVVAARLTYGGAPEALQGAVAAGLIGAGSAVLGSMENGAVLLKKICESEQGIEAAALAEVKAYKAAGKFLPGFGHPYHKPDDPRTAKLFEVAQSVDVDGTYISAVGTLSGIVDEVYGKHLTVNAALAIAAILLEIDMPPMFARGLAVVARAGGLLAHLLEEQNDPTTWSIIKGANDAVPYREQSELS